MVTAPRIAAEFDSAQWAAQWTVADSRYKLNFDCLRRFQVNLNSRKSVRDALKDLFALGRRSVGEIFVDLTSSKAGTCGAYLELMKILYQLDIPSRYDTDHRVTRVLARMGGQERSFRVSVA